MKPVYQTIFDNKKGNCMAACYASLMEVPLEDVPNFILYGKAWYDRLQSFLSASGYQYHSSLANPNHFDSRWESYEKFPKTLQGYPSFDGFYDAAVVSPGYFSSYTGDFTDTFPVRHAVVIDKDYNIIHDPNPRYKSVKKYPMAEQLGYNGILSIILWERTDDTEK